MNIHYRYRRAKEIISTLENSFEEFKKEYAPSITFSDEIPPIFLEKGQFKGQEKKEKLENYPVDELMGAYFPETRNIVIYLQGINRVTNDLNKKINIPNLYENLMKIVILHEIGHYWFHNVVFKTGLKIDKEPHSFFTEKNHAINEWVAQMFTFYCIINNKALLGTIGKLAEFQPPEYGSYAICQNVGIGKFKTSIKKLRISTNFKQTADLINSKFGIDAYIAARIYGL